MRAITVQLLEQAGVIIITLSCIYCTCTFGVGGIFSLLKAGNTVHDGADGGGKELLGEDTTLCLRWNPYLFWTGDFSSLEFKWLIKLSSSETGIEKLESRCQQTDAVLVLGDRQEGLLCTVNTLLSSPELSSDIKWKSISFQYDRSFSVLTILLLLLNSWNIFQLQ